MWPKISIVVPNFNNGASLERCLISLFTQDYPELEILVVDGGSTDTSKECIQRHQERLAWWVSEPDRGQSHAINKGLQRCSGDVVNWLCSDDWLEAGALKQIAGQFQQSRQTDVLVGACRIHHGIDHNAPTEVWDPSTSPGPASSLPYLNPIPQPSCYYRRQLLRHPDGLREDLHYTMDFELWAYFASQRFHFTCIPNILSNFTLTPQTKTGSGGWKIIREMDLVYRLYSGELIPLSTAYGLLRLPLDALQKRQPRTALARLSKPLWHLSTLALSACYGHERLEQLALGRRWAIPT